MLVFYILPLVKSSIISSFFLLLLAERAVTSPAAGMRSPSGKDASKSRRTWDGWISKSSGDRQTLVTSGCIRALPSGSYSECVFYGTSFDQELVFGPPVEVLTAQVLYIVPFFSATQMKEWDRVESAQLERFYQQFAKKLLGAKSGHALRLFFVWESLLCCFARAFGADHFLKDNFHRTHARHSLRPVLQARARRKHGHGKLQNSRCKPLGPGKRDGERRRQAARMWKPGAAQS